MAGQKRGQLMLPLKHPARFGRGPFMVVAEQVKHPVDQQRTQPGRDFDIQLARLAGGGFDRNHDIAERDRRLGRARRRREGVWTELGKRQNVGSAILAAKVSIQTADRAVGHETQRKFGLRRAHRAHQRRGV